MADYNTLIAAYRTARTSAGRAVALSNLGDHAGDRTAYAHPGPSLVGWQNRRLLFRVLAEVELAVGRGGWSGVSGLGSRADALLAEMSETRDQAARDRMIRQLGSLLGDLAGMDVIAALTGRRFPWRPAVVFAAALVGFAAGVAWWTHPAAVGVVIASIAGMSVTATPLLAWARGQR